MMVSDPGDKSDVMGFCGYGCWIQRRLSVAVLMSEVQDCSSLSSVSVLYKSFCLPTQKSKNGLNGADVWPLSQIHP